MFFGRIASLVVSYAAIAGVFGQIPIVSDWAFWFMVGAYFIWATVHRLGKGRFRLLLMIEIVLILVAIVGVFVQIPIVSDYAFWIMTAANLSAVSGTR
jgi:hypothetical protein